VQDALGFIREKQSVVSVDQLNKLEYIREVSKNKSHRFHVLKQNALRAQMQRKKALHEQPLAACQMADKRDVFNLLY